MLNLCANEDRANTHGNDERDNDHEIHIGSADPERPVAASFGEADAARGRDLAVLRVRGAGRVATLVFDLGLVMGSSEVGATPSAAPPQPCRTNSRAGRRSKARIWCLEVRTATLRSSGKASHF